MTRPPKGEQPHKRELSPEEFPHEGDACVKTLAWQPMFEYPNIHSQDEAALSVSSVLSDTLMTYTKEKHTLLKGLGYLALAMSSISRAAMVGSNPNQEFMSSHVSRFFPLLPSFPLCPCPP